MFVEGSSCNSEMVPKQVESASFGDADENGPSLTLGGASVGGAASNGNFVLGLKAREKSYLGETHVLLFILINAFHI